MSTSCYRTCSDDRGAFLAEVEVSKENSILRSEKCYARPCYWSDHQSAVLRRNGAACGGVSGGAMLARSSGVEDISGAHLCGLSPHLPTSWER